MITRVEARKLSARVDVFCMNQRDATRPPSTPRGPRDKPFTTLTPNSKGPGAGLAKL